MNAPGEGHVVDRTDVGRYEWVVGDHVVAYADYTVVGDAVVLPHTVTLPAYRGQGHAGRLVQSALDEVRRSGRRVVPQCWFVAQYIDDHPAYADLLA